MDRKIALAALVLMGVVLISGCTEPLDEEAQDVKASAGEWLKGEQGMARFPGGAAGEPLTVWKEGEAFYWIAPIEDSKGLYIGNLIVTQENFTSPQQIVEYREPRDRILNTTGSEAYQQMIMENPDYPAYQIEKPILLAIAGKGLSWYSQVKSGNEVLDELYIETFTLF